MTRGQIEELEKAEEILTALYWDIRDEYGCKKEAKRLDTILAKLSELIIIAYQGDRKE